MAISSAISFPLSSPSTTSLHRSNHRTNHRLLSFTTASSSSSSTSLLSLNHNHNLHLSRNNHNHNLRRHNLAAFSFSGDGNHGGELNHNSHDLRRRNFAAFSSSDDGNNGGENGGGGNNGGGNGGGGDGEGESERNKREAMMVLAEVGRKVETLPADLAAAIEEGKISVEIVRRFLNLEGLGFIKWLLQFSGFRERLLADDLFLAKLGMECGVGMFTKTLAEYERRRETFFNELEVVFADVAMAVIADFMLVYLPAPTISFRQPLSMNAGRIAKFFHSCPDNAFQIALGGASYSFMQRFGSFLRNGAKLFAVGTGSSLVGTAVTNAVINARKAVDKSGGEEVENVPIVSTSVAYGVYMAVSSNLRYQLLSGVIEQRILEPMLHNHKLMLSALCFAVRTGNTFFGSLLWVDYARLIGIQKAHNEEHA